MWTEAVVQGGHGVKQNQGKPKNTEASDNPNIICLNADRQQSPNTNQCQNGADQMRNTIEPFTIIHSDYQPYDLVFSLAQ